MNWVFLVLLEFKQIWKNVSVVECANWFAQIVQLSLTENSIHCTMNLYTLQ